MKKVVFKGASVVAIGNVSGQVCALARNIIIARAIGPDNFGLAATFVVTVSLLEMLSDLSLDKMLVQAKDGNKDHLQACAQFLQALRGVVLSILLFATARPVALAFDAPHAIWAYQTLALLPLIRGLAHLDVKRFQREFRFMPFAIVEVIPQVIGLATTIIIIEWIHDYSVALWIILVQTVVMVGLSHILAERSYRWLINREAAIRFYRFGWPLVLNGLFLWVAMQSDRVVTGTMLSTAALGTYAAAANMLMMPTALILKVGGQVGLPLLARRQDNAAAFSYGFGVVSQYIVATVVVVFVPLMVIMPFVIPSLYGEAFASSTTFLAILVAAFAIRAARALPVLAALSLGETKTVATGNLVRAAGIPFIVVAATSGSLMWIACGVLFVEIASFVAIWYWLGRVMKSRHYSMPATSVVLTLFTGLAVFTIGAIAFPMSSWVTALVVATASSVLCGCWVLAMLPHVRAGLVQAIRRRGEIWSRFV